MDISGITDGMGLVALLVGGEDPFHFSRIGFMMWTTDGTGLVALLVRGEDPFHFWIGFIKFG